MSTIYHKDRVYEAIGRIAGEVIRAKSTAKLISAVAKNIIGDWTGGSRIKKRLMSPVDWVLERIARKGDGKKPATAPVIPAEVGRIITLLAAAANEANAKAAPVDEAIRGQSVRSLLQNLDFGEILEMVEGSEPHVLRAIETFNTELWKYPAKVGTLVATIIALLNILIKSSREILVPIEEAIGPDLLADIILSILKGITGADAAKLADAVREVIRRVHTGSLLLGKGGKSLFQVYLTDFITQFLSATDPELVRKVRIILAEDGEAVANATADALVANPHIALSYLASLGAVKTSGVKAKSRRLDVVEDMDEDGLKAAVSESVSDLDTYEIAELVNKACRVFNRIRNVNPDAVGAVMNSVVDSLDVEEIRSTASWLIPEVVSALRPVAAQVMPLIITGLGKLMSPEGEPGMEHKEALKAFRTALAAGGKS
jgi:hypothetical protein